MGILLRQPLLTADDEIALARAVEAGVLAAAVLNGLAEPAPRPGGRPRTDELATLVDLGDRARRRLWESNLRLVKLVSVRLAARSGVAEDDLFQEGCLGLADAISRYDHRRGVRFASFALPWIRWRIGDAVGRAQPIALSVHRRDQHRIAVRERAAAEARLGRHLDAHHRAEQQGRAGWAAIAAERVLLGVMPLDENAIAAVADGGQDDPYERVEACPVPWPALLGRLPERQRVVIELRYGFAGPARTVTDTAAELGVSHTTVRRAEQRALVSLRRWVDQLGLEVADLLVA